MKNYRALIIEDEQPARDRLRKLLREQSLKIDLLGEASDGEQGLEMARNLQPDLIFLDIKMPILNGFELLNKLENPPFIIFTTAFEQYALRAFEENSIDYLLKPISKERLAKALEKLDRRDEKPALDLQSIKELLQGSKPSPAAPQSHISVKKGDRILLIKMEEIAFFQAQDKYVELNTADGKKHLISQTLNHLEDNLPGNFLRIHRSFILNREHVNEIRKGFKGRYRFAMKDAAENNLQSGNAYSGKIRDYFDF